MKNLQVQNSNSRFKRHSVSLFFIKFFSTVASFLVIYYYSHHLSETDYGIYQIIWTRSFFLSAFAGLGIASLVFTYKPSVLKHLLLSAFHSKKVFLLIPLTCSIIFAGLQADNGGSFFTYLIFFALYISCNTLETTLGALHLFRWLPVISLLYALGFCCIHYYTFYLGYDVLFLFRWLLPLLLLRCGIYIGILNRGVKRIAVENDEQDSFKIKSLWKHLYFFEASQIVILYADKFLLSHFLPASDFAIYFNATISIPFIGLAFSAINNAAFMEFAQEKNLAKRITILHHAGRLLSSVAFPCFFFLWFFSEEIFSILFSDKYLAAIPIFLVTLLALPIRSIYPNTLVLQSGHYGKVINKGVFLDVIASFALFFPLYFLIGLKGVALSFVIGTLLQAGYYLIASGKVMGVSAFRLVPLKNWFIKLVLSGGGILALHQILTMYLTPVQTLIAGGVIISSVSLLLLWKEFKT